MALLVAYISKMFSTIRISAAILWPDVSQIFMRSCKSIVVNQMMVVFVIWPPVSYFGMVYNLCRTDDNFTVCGLS